MADLIVNKIDYTPKTVIPRVETLCEDIQTQLNNMADIAESTLQNINLTMQIDKAAITKELGSTNVSLICDACAKLQELVKIVSGVDVDNTVNTESMVK